MTNTCNICIPCIDGSPYANLSCEGPEPFLFRAIGYCCDGSVLESESTVSYVDAFEDVQRRLLTECPACDKPRTFCADALCPDGALLTTVCVTTSQADANAAAAAKAAEMVGDCNGDGTVTTTYTANCSCPDGSEAHTTHSDTSQAEADAECAAIPKNCSTSFGNLITTCNAYCPDGSPFTYVLGANRFWANTQAEANAIAASYACKLAKIYKICLGSIQSECCISTAYNSTIRASGAFLDANFNFWTLAGSLPPGLNLEFIGYGPPNNPITGTPTTAGTYSFTVRITAPNHDYMEKTYTICVIDITSNPAGSDAVHLPDAAFGEDYTATLEATSCAHAPLSWQIVSGSLPIGLSLDEETGAVSGTCVDDPGDYTFTVKLQTSAT